MAASESPAYEREKVNVAAYRVEVADVRDQVEWGPEWSRRARGIPLYAALRSLGRIAEADSLNPQVTLAWARADVDPPASCYCGVRPEQ